MKFNELVNKEVIDKNGDFIGKVKDIEWNNKTKRIISIEIASGGIKSFLGMSEKQILPFDNIEIIGDRVLLKRHSPETTGNDDELEFDLDYYTI
ncbi:MAG: PRC-barrel domain-containing protein [Methanobacterium sp.]|nr:PRC-barrel domain-containing protein [Methanobacterium sp.]